MLSGRASVSGLEGRRFIQIPKLPWNFFGISPSLCVISILSILYTATCWSLYFTMFQVLEYLFEKGGNAVEIVNKKNLWKISDEESVTEICIKVLQANPGAVSERHKRSKI